MEDKVEIKISNKIPMYKYIYGLLFLFITSSCMNSEKNLITQFYYLNKSLKHRSDIVYVKNGNFALKSNEPITKLILKGHETLVGHNLIFEYKNYNRTDKNIVIAGGLHLTIVIEKGLNKKKGIINFSDNNVLVFFTTGVPHSSNLPLLGYGYDGIIEYEILDADKINVKIIGKLKTVDYITAEHNRGLIKNISIEGVFAMK